MDFLKKASHDFGGEGGEGGEHDLMKLAQGFLRSHGSSDQQHTQAPAATSGQTPQTPVAPPAAGSAPGPGSHGYSEVYGSAQMLYQGLQDKLSGKETHIDNHQLAKAASDVLKAADKAGFVKGTKYEQYFGKAESYLGNYGQPKGAAHTADPSAPSTNAPHAAAPPRYQ